MVPAGWMARAHSAAAQQEQVTVQVRYLTVSTTVIYRNPTQLQVRPQQQQGSLQVRNLWIPYRYSRATLSLRSARTAKTEKTGGVEKTGVADTKTVAETKSTKSEAQPKGTITARVHRLFISHSLATLTGERECVK